MIKLIDTEKGKALDTETCGLTDKVEVLDPKILETLGRVTCTDGDHIPGLGYDKMACPVRAINDMYYEMDEEPLRNTERNYDKLERHHFFAGEHFRGRPIEAVLKDAEKVCMECPGYCCSFFSCQDCRGAEGDVCSEGKPWQYDIIFMRDNQVQHTNGRGFTCKQFDPHKGFCNSHESRPSICSRYICIHALLGEVPEPEDMIGSKYMEQCKELLTSE